MKLTHQQYINFLINESKRNLVTRKLNFFKSLCSFIDSEEGKKGFLQFQQLNAFSIGLDKQPEHISQPIRRIFEK